MTKFLLPALLSLVAFTANAQYSETFSTPDRGYLPNFIDNFTGVDWTLSAWEQAPNPWRDDLDAFQTGPGTASGIPIPAGVLGGGDFDQEVCWTSPLLNSFTNGNVTFTADITYAGFDGNQNLAPFDAINVEYQVMVAPGYVKPMLLA